MFFDGFGWLGRSATGIMVLYFELHHVYLKNKPKAVVSRSVPATQSGLTRETLRGIIYHEKFKRLRLRFTRIRIKEMNQLFDITDRIRKIALVIFADKPEVARLFG